MHFLINLKKIFQNNIETDFEELINSILDKYADHPNINRNNVINWIRQFPSKTRRICPKIVDFLSYYSSSCLNAMTNELIRIIQHNYSNYRLNEIGFVPIGGAGSGAQLIARRIKSIRGIPKNNIVNLFELTQTDIKNRLKAIVFIDDFSGTGNTIKDWLLTIEPIILPLGLEMSFGILVLNYVADEELSKINKNIHFIEYLNKNRNIFYNECNSFSSNEKAAILTACKITCCTDTYLKGYGECGLLVSFQHGCPNNSLPILWYSSKKWINLFNRREV